MSKLKPKRKTTKQFSKLFRDKKLIQAQLRGEVTYFSKKHYI